MKHVAWSCVFAALLAAPAAAQDAPKRPVPDREQVEVLNSEGFLAAHPDLRWRRDGLHSLQQGRDAEAFARFKRAARYADKPSQAMVAEMLWLGRGVEQNRPLAYAWMDIAAERAYIPFVAKREQYWAALSVDERNRAIDVGLPLLAEYGDAAAKPRLETLLKRARRDVTGSRTGFVGNLRVIIPGPGGVPITIDGSEYYKPEYWRPEKYWAWQDSIWKDPPTGTVTVRPLETVEDEGETEAAPTGD